MSGLGRPRSTVATKKPLADIPTKVVQLNDSDRDEGDYQRVFDCRHPRTVPAESHQSGARSIDGQHHFAAGALGSAVAPDNRALTNVVLSRVALPAAKQVT